MLVLPGDKPLEMAGCTAWAAYSTGEAGCFEASAKGHGNNGFEATPPTATGAGCRTGFAMSSSSPTAVIQKVEVVRSTELTPALVSAVEDAVVADARAKFTELMASWPKEFDELKEVLLSGIEADLRASIQENRILLIHWE